MKRIVLIILLIAATGGIVVALVSNRHTQQAEQAKAQQKLPATVVAAQVTKQSLETATEFIGKTEAWQEVQLTAPTQGIVRELFVKLNTSVQEGQTIATVDTDLINIARSTAEASLQKARTDLRRYETLHQENNATAAELETARLQVITAQSQVETIRKQLRDAVIKAPIRGTITEKPVERGMYIAPGIPLMTITDVTAVKLVIDVPEGELNLFATGKQVSIVFDAYPETVFYGKVHYTRLKGVQAGRFPVEIRVVNTIPTRPLRVGMTGTVHLPIATSLTGLTIPRSALVTQSQQPSVYVYAQNRVFLRPIQTGQTVGTTILVKGGLSQGELVVTSGTDELRNGQTVTLTNPTKLY